MPKPDHFTADQSEAGKLTRGSGSLRLRSFPDARDGAPVLELTADNLDGVWAAFHLPDVPWLIARLYDALEHFRAVDPKASTMAMSLGVGRFMPEMERCIELLGGEEMPGTLADAVKAKVQECLDLANGPAGD